MEVLAAFIREHSHEQWPLAEPGAETPKRTTRPDIQAAISVVGRRNTEHDRRPVDLYNAILVNADLDDADLAGAILIGANLKRAHLVGVILSGAKLHGIVGFAGGTPSSSA